MLCIAEVDQGVEAGYRFENNISTLAAVAAVGPAIFDIFLTPETNRAGAAPAGLDVNLRLIQKMHGLAHSRLWCGIKPRRLLSTSN